MTPLPTAFDGNRDQKAGEMPYNAFLPVLSPLEGENGSWRHRRHEFGVSCDFLVDQNGALGQNCPVQRRETVNKRNEQHLKNRIPCRMAKDSFHATPSLFWCFSRLMGIQPGGGIHATGFFTLTPLNREPVTRHRLTETCAAPLRGMLRLAVAKDSPDFPTERRENDNPQSFGLGREGRASSNVPKRAKLVQIQHQTPEDCGFLFCSHFMSRIMRCPNYTRCMTQQAFIATRKLLYSFLVGVLSFSALFFSFTLTCYVVLSY